jgi:hypothetical protein
LRVLAIGWCAALCPAGAELATHGDELAGSAPTLRAGVYVGVLSEQPFPQMLYELSHPHLAPSYLAGAHAVRTLHRFARIPLDLELEGGIARRFGEDHQTELDLIPMLRWKRLPWNDCLYTNVRLGLLGLSYASGISGWEQQSSATGRGSRVLNLVIPELTFARNANASWEFFLRAHHRSGIYGAIHGTHGGSSYYAAGVRFTLR